MVSVYIWVRGVVKAAKNICGAVSAYTPTRELVHLKTNIEERACDLAVFIIENKATVRAAAQKFGISKSTVHKDLSERLKEYNLTLYKQVKDILEQNKAERHLRGGEATRRKYSSRSEKV